MIPSNEIAPCRPWERSWNVDSRTARAGGGLRDFGLAQPGLEERFHGREFGCIHRVGGLPLQLQNAPNELLVVAPALDEPGALRLVEELVHGLGGKPGRLP